MRLQPGFLTHAAASIRAQHWIALACLCAFSFASAVASADDVLEEERPSVWRSQRLRLEALAGYGFGDATLPTDKVVNGFATGAGARVAYVSSIGLTAGLRFQHFFGSRIDYHPGITSVRHEAQADLLTGEFGWEFPIEIAALRPSIAAGAMLSRRSADCSVLTDSFGDVADSQCAVLSQSSSEWFVVAAPGLSFAVAAGRLYGLMDVRYYIKSSDDALGLYGGVGVLL